jgi:hypothetical protein
MTAGFIYQYEVGWTKNAASAVLSSFEGLGLHIRNPSDGRVVAVSNEWESMGEPIVTDEHSLVDRLALNNRSEQSFNYWVEADVNVYCRVRRVASELVVQEYALDGLMPAQQDFVVRAIISIFLQRLATAVGLVVDRTGVSEDTDWDQVILANPVRMLEVPDLLVVTEIASLQLGNTIGVDGLLARKVGELIAYDRGGLLDM